MKRRLFLKCIGGAAAMLPAVTVTAKTREKLNFVFFLVDDLGWRDLACFGSTFYETPNIDRLCGSGMKFTNAYAACPVCSPTRASIMTGKYPARINTTDFFGGPQPGGWRRNTRHRPARYLDRMPLEETTLAEAFKEAGYTTFFAGKWHLGPQGYWPEDQGFDVNKGGVDRGGPYGGKKYFSPYGNPRLEDGPDGEHLPDRLASEAAGFIAKHIDKPFLAYLAFYSVHTPLMSRADLREKYAKKKEELNLTTTWGQERSRKVREVQEHVVYAGMVEAVDQAVGKVADRLKKLGLEKNTAIIFMSDNGGLSTSEGHPTSNLPLRAGKGWLYEGGIREPMFVLWPGVTKKGSVCDTPVISTDFYPTMLEMAGLPSKKDQHVDGESMVPLLKGKAEGKPRAIYWHYPHHGNQGASPGGAVREGDWKLIDWFADDTIELFNLNEDPGEKKNLAKEKPEIVDRLMTMLKAWRKDVDARMSTPNPNFKPAGK